MDCDRSDRVRGSLAKLINPSSVEVQTADAPTHALIFSLDLNNLKGRSRCIPAESDLAKNPEEIRMKSTNPTRTMVVQGTASLCLVSFSLLFVLTGCSARTPLGDPAPQPAAQSETPAATAEPTPSSSAPEPAAPPASSTPPAPPPAPDPVPPPAPDPVPPPAPDPVPPTPDPVPPTPDPVPTPEPDAAAAPPTEVDAGTPPDVDASADASADPDAAAPSGDQ